MTEAPGIRWRAWDEVAFREARDTDKPILLRLSAVWCHWCHVMDSTSDREPEAIRLLNERFVPIRVDIDKMPHVRERYNFGGFPTSAFLTPEGQVMTGGTYIPPERFVALLHGVADAYATRKAELLAQIQQHQAHRGTHAPPAPADGGFGDVARDLVDAVSQSIRLNFDASHGGFGSQPKFPHSAALDLALRLSAGPEGRAFETVARRTLSSMRDGALWDREEKGFFRYSVTADWSEPHYEKMLETNAGLLRNYARGVARLDEERFAATCHEMRGYLEATLRDPSSGRFRGSQDADEAYYALPLAARRIRQAPYVDPASYTDWSAEMIEGYFEAYRCLGNEAWLHEGLRALDGLLAAAWADGALYHFADATKRGTAGILSDHAHLLRALVSAYELTADPRRLVSAQAILASAERLWDPNRMLYADRRPGASDFGLLREPTHPVPDNGTMAWALARLSHHLDRASHRERVEALLRALAPQAERQGLFASDAALAALEATLPPLEVSVVGSTAEVAPLLREAARIPYARVVVRRYEAAGAKEATRKAGIGAVVAPAAFACAGQACSRLFRPGDRFAAEVARLVGG